MSFLQLSLLPSLLPLALLPFVIHLLSRRLSRPLEFPSVENLKVSMTRSAAIYRWRHWLFLLLRTLLLLLIIAAILQPVLLRTGAKPAASARMVYILIDNSLSMEHTSGGKSALDRAQSEAERIINTLRAGDLLNVIQVGLDTIPAFPQAVEDWPRATAFIQEIGEGVSRADFSRANRQLAAVTNQASIGTEIYYLSDFQRSDWANVDFRPLPPEARVFFVDIGASDRDNRALTNLRVEGETVASGLVTIEAELANFTGAGREESIELQMDGRPVTAQSIYVAPNSIGTTRFSLALPEEGTHLITLRIAADDLPADDRLVGVIQVSEKEEILLLGTIAPEAEEDSKNVSPGTVYLEAALNPFPGVHGAVRPRRIDITSLTQADLAGVTKLFIHRPGTIPPEQAERIIEFIFSGGGVVWWLDDAADPQSLREFADVLGDEQPALQLGPWRETDTLQASQQILSGDFDSPFLKLFSGTRRQDLSRLEVYDSFAAAHSGDGSILLSYTDGTPALSVQSHGLGQLLLVNFSPDTAHSNLANQRFFPIWIQSLIGAFSSERAEPLFVHVGDRIIDSLWREDIRTSRFIDPKGDKLNPSIEVTGTRASVSFDARYPGIYHLSQGDALISAFAVNPPPEEADLRPIDMRTLPDRQGAPTQTNLLSGGANDFQQVVLGKPIFHWFIYGGLLIVVLELILHLVVRRYQPRALQA